MNEIIEGSRFICGSCGALTSKLEAGLCVACYRVSAHAKQKGHPPNTCEMCGLRAGYRARLIERDPRVLCAGCWELVN